MLVKYIGKTNHRRFHGKYYRITKVESEKMDTYAQVWISEENYGVSSSSWTYWLDGIIELPKVDDSFIEDLSYSGESHDWVINYNDSYLTIDELLEKLGLINDGDTYGSYRDSHELFLSGDLYGFSPQGDKSDVEKWWDDMVFIPLGISRRPTFWN